MLAAQRRQEAGESDGESDAGSEGEGSGRSSASARPASAPASRRAPPAARPGFVGVPQQLASGGVFRPGRFIVAQPALRQGGGGGGGGGGSVALLEDALRRAKTLRVEADELSARRDQRPALRKAREAALLEAELTRAPRRLRRGYVRATRTSFSAYCAYRLRVPEAQGGLPHVLYAQAMRTRLGRAVRTAHRAPPAAQVGCSSPQARGGGEAPTDAPPERASRPGRFVPRRARSRELRRPRYNPRYSPRRAPCARPQARAARRRPPRAPAASADAPRVRVRHGLLHARSQRRREGRCALSPARSGLGAATQP